MKMNIAVLLILNLHLLIFGCKKKDSQEAEPALIADNNCTLKMMFGSGGVRDTIKVLENNAQGYITKLRFIQERESNVFVQTDRIYEYNTQNKLVKISAVGLTDNETIFSYDTDGKVSAILDKYTYSDGVKTVLYKDSSIYTLVNPLLISKIDYKYSFSSTTGAKYDTNYVKIELNAEQNPTHVYEKMDFSGAIQDTFLLTSKYTYSYDIPASFKPYSLVFAYEGSFTLFNSGKTRLIDRIETYNYSYNGTTIIKTLGDIANTYSYNFDALGNLIKADNGNYLYNCQ